MSSGQARTAEVDRALVLLGQGLDPGVVSGATGLSAGRISQLLSDIEFTSEVAELRFKSLVRHTERDQKADTLEDKLLEMLENCLPFMEHKPMVILRAYQTLNAAKRRGATAPEHIAKPAEVINLNMPVTVMQKFITNINGMVIKAGNQELVTVQSSRMDPLLAAAKLERERNEVPLLERSS